MKQKIKGFLALCAIGIAVMLTGVKAEAAPITQSAQTNKTITLKWTADKDAAKYQVLYMKHGDSKIVTKETTTVSYQITGLTPGTCYILKIRSVSKAGAVKDIATGYGYTLPDKVASVSLTNYNSLLNGAVQIASLNWTDLYSASGQKAVDGYEYIIKNSKNKVVEQGDTPAAGLKSTKMKSTSTYTVQVRAYINTSGTTKIYGSWSSVFTIVPQPLILHNSTKTLIMANKQLKVSWKKMTGVTSYDIYVSSNPTSGYKKVGSAAKSKTSATIKKSYEPNTTYYVVVVAKKDKVTSYKPKKNVPFEYYPVRKSAWFN